MSRFFLLIFFIFSLVLCRPALATTIFSPVLEMTVEPGKTESGILKVYNETDFPLTLQASVEAFTAGDESGQPQYLPAAERRDYLNWFKLSSDSLKLNARQAAVVPFSVTVPAKALPGGYYAVVFWQSGGLEGQSAVSINSKVGTLVLVRVTGEVKESGEIVEFGPVVKSDMLFDLPISFTVRFSNIGNIHLAPSGEIEIKNWLGKKNRLAINAEKRFVLPGSIRRFDAVWSNLTPPPNSWQGFWQKVRAEIRELAIGKYTATLHLTYGRDAAAELTREVTFWYWPWRTLIVLLGGGILLRLLLRIRKKINIFKQAGKKNHETKNS